MTAPPAPRVIWTGLIGESTYRVVDLGPGLAVRLIVEIRQPPDAMGGFGWARFDPIPSHVFQAMLLASGVVR
jgi:hypothetical protein